MKFYRCSHCGNIIVYMENKGVPVMCCGQKMEEIIPGSTDAALEKHVPVIIIDGNKVTVTVGEVATLCLKSIISLGLYLKPKADLCRKSLM